MQLRLLLFFYFSMFVGVGRLVVFAFHLLGRLDGVCVLFSK